MREAIQLQFGPVSNLIGARFLDLLISAAQASNDTALDQQVMLNGSGLEPRLVAFDLQSSFQQPILDPEAHRDIDSWTESRTIHHLSSTTPAVEGVESWSKALASAGLRLERRNQVRLPNPDGNLFRNGIETVESVLDDAIDAVRHQIEKCDSLETIHTLADTDSMHGAVAAVVLEQVRDDYCTSQQSLMTLPIWSASTTLDTDALVNRMLACARLYEGSSALVMDRDPMPNLEMSVAYQALALYAGSVCYRLRTSLLSSGDLLRTLVFDPMLRLVSLRASLEPETTGPPYRRQYRVAIGMETEAQCKLTSRVLVGAHWPLRRGRQTVSRHSKVVPFEMVADWTSAEPTFDRILRLSHTAQSLSAAMATTRYLIDDLDYVRESYCCLVDNIASYHDSSAGFAS